MAGLSEGMQMGHLIAQDTIDLFNTGYNVYQDQRNFNYQQGVFDYQKALQQQIFDREDTAVQRRRKDLEAAGLNPNLAAGSAAGAGAVVGVSSGPGDHNISRANLLQNYGAYLDAKKAAQEAKQAEYMTDYLKNKSENDYVNRENNQIIEAIKNYYNSNQDVSDLWVLNFMDRQGRPRMKIYSLEQAKNIVGTGLEENGWTWNPKTKTGLDSYNNPFSFQKMSETKYWKSLENGWTMEMNDVSQSNLDTSMLTTEEEYQTSDKWFNYIFKALNLIFGGGGVSGAARNRYQYKR